MQPPTNMPEAKWKGKINRELKRGAASLCRIATSKTHYGMVPTYRM